MLLHSSDFACPEDKNATIWNKATKNITSQYQSPYDSISRKTILYLIEEEYKILSSPQKEREKAYTLYPELDPMPNFQQYQPQLPSKQQTAPKQDAENQTSIKIKTKDAETQTNTKPKLTITTNDLTIDDIKSTSPGNVKKTR